MGLFRDIRWSIRSLAKSPGFTLVALITLALGIGANTAIFSVVNAVLLHPLPYPQPGRIVAVYRTEPDNGLKSGTFSYGFATVLSRRLTSVELLSAYHVWPFTITAPGKPDEVGGVASSAAMFRLLGIHPILGRPFTSKEDRRGAPPVALISETLWHNRFAGDPSVLGKSVTLGGEPYTVIGVFPGNLRFPYLGQPPDIWVPLPSDPLLKSMAAEGMDPQKISYLSVLGRLAPGTDPQKAQAQADTLAAALAKVGPKGKPTTGLRIALLEHEVSKNLHTALGVLLGAVGLVLLIACANVANLLLARATTREREVALRMALGAGKVRVMRQMLFESVALSLAGGALGAYVAYLGVVNLGHWIPQSLTQYRGVTVSATVLLFAAAVSVLAGILAGLLPAWHVSDVNVYATLKEGGRGTSGSRRRLREGLVVVEVALAVMLLVGAGLLLHSFSRLVSADPGYQPKGVAMASVRLPHASYSSPSQWRAFVSSVLERLRAEPGVTQAVAAATPPMAGAKISTTYTAVGQPAPPPGQEPVAEVRSVTPGYFALMHIPLLAGRALAASDSASSAHVCVINQALARASFPGINPLGHSLSTGKGKPWQIVGVVGNLTTILGTSPEKAIYPAFDQAPFWLASFLARGPQKTDALLPLLRDSIRSVDRNLPIDSSTLVEKLDGTVAPERYRTELIGSFAGLAILLSAVGISGVLGYSVTRRRQEIGVRMALGAMPRDVLRQIVREGLRLVAVGAAVGLVASFGLTRLMRSLLYGVGPSDPLTYVSVAILLLLVALAACAVPALRAAHVDPNVALRHE